MNQNKLKVVFFSSSEFCLPILKHLINSTKYELLGVITQPDWENRGRIFKNPVAKFAENNKIRLFQPFKLRKNLIEFIDFFPDVELGIVASYGQILSEEILNIPKLGMINWHPSLLPLYRGPTPLQTSLYNGDLNGGLTWIKMNKGMDSGELIKQYPQMYNDNTFTQLISIFGELGATTIDDVIELYLLNKYTPQKENIATFTKMLTKEMSFIENHSKKTILEFYNHFKAFDYFPKTTIKTEKYGLIKILSASKMNLIEIKIEEEDQDFYYYKGKFYLKLKDGILGIEELQLSSGRRIKSSK
jgi:methionyl-tRNA formyltransferase